MGTNFQKKKTLCIELESTWNTCVYETMTKPSAVSDWLTRVLSGKGSKVRLCVFYLRMFLVSFINATSMPFSFFVTKCFHPKFNISLYLLLLSNSVSLEEANQIYYDSIICDYLEQKFKDTLQQGTVMFRKWKAKLRTKLVKLGTLLFFTFRNFSSLHLMNSDFERQPVWHSP